MSPAGSAAATASAYPRQHIPAKGSIVSALSRLREVREASAAHEAAPASSRTCANPSCGASGAGLRRCADCGSVLYCSAACQRAHWKAHKAECRRLQAAAVAGSSGSTSIAGPSQPPKKERR